MKTLKIILFLFLLFQIKTLNSQCLQRDIMLVGDFSHSTNGYEDFIKEAFNAFIDRFDLSENTIKIGSIIFSDEAFLISKLSTDKEKLKSLVNTMDKKVMHGKTNIYDALSLSEIELSKNGRKNIKKIIIIISDGDGNGPYFNYIPALVKIINDNPNIKICGILVDSESKNEILMKNISFNRGENCYYSTKYEFLVDLLSQLDICT